MKTIYNAFSMAPLSKIKHQVAKKYATGNFFIFTFKRYKNNLQCIFNDPVV